MKRRITTTLISAALVSIAALASAAAGPDGPPDTPADVTVEVASPQAAPGATVGVTVQLAARPGIQINRYPKISVNVDAVDGLVGEAAGAVGNDRAPSPEEMESGANYYGASVDPVVFDLSLDAGAAPGAHLIPAKLKYYYCVKKSGFCAPKKTTVEIPVTVR